MGVALVVWAVLSASAFAQQDAAQVRVDAVRAEAFSQTVPVLGRLVASRSGEIAANVAGSVESLGIEVGDRVVEGAVLALIDEERLSGRALLARARVEAARAQIAADQAELDLVSQERQRLQRLRNSAAFSLASLEDKDMEIRAAEARIARAGAQLDEAAADLRIAERDLADARVTAPYPGVVTQKYVNAGNYVQVGEPVVALVDDGSLEIEADVPSRQARVLPIGTPVDAALEDGTPLQATLRAVVPDENPLTRTLALRFGLQPDPAGRLLANGETVTVTLPTAAVEQVVTVHKDAVIRRGPGAVVFVAVDGKAEVRPVQLGDAVGDRFVVRDGLAVDDLVVVRGNERLRPDQPIQFEAS